MALPLQAMVTLVTASRSYGAVLCGFAGMHTEVCPHPMLEIQI